MRSFTIHTLFVVFLASLLQVHAGIPGNGTYRIQNVGTTTYLDFPRGDQKEGTLIVGRPLIETDNAMQWECIRKGDNLVLFRNVLSKFYLDAPEEQEDGFIIGSENPGIFKLQEVGSNTYNLRTHDDKFALYLPGRQNGAQADLKTSNSNDKKQLWRLQKVHRKSKFIKTKPPPEDA